jgi:hypothetical protein
MSSRLASLLITALVVLAIPNGALGKTRYVPVPTQTTELGSPISGVASLSQTPLGFTTTAAEAVQVAERTPAMQRIHRREHPLSYVPYVWHLGSLYWYVTFYYHGHLVAEVNVSTAGRLLAVWTGPQALAPYAHGHYAPGFDRWWVIVGFSLMFLAPFVDPRRLGRLVVLDALVILSFLLSYLLLDHAHLQSAVWLAYPPLIYLLARMLWVGFRGVRSAGRLAPLVRTNVLVVGLLVLVGGRIAISLLSGSEIDVGYASVLGAQRIAHGAPLYFADPGHGDTYGPINYLAYLPFAQLFPVKGSWTSHLWAADLASITFDLATIVGLLFLGRRLRRGSEGTRLGLVLAWGWAACPFTVLALVRHTNDGLISMLSVFALLVFARPVLRGVMLGLAAAAKFSPAALLPLFAAPRRSVRGAVACVVSFGVVVVTAIALYLPPGGLSEFYNRTIGFQLNRPDVFSPWALHPGLHPVQTAIEILAIGLVLVVAFVPKERSIIVVSALAAAVTIAIQLPAVHWFYYYILWFLPFVLVALFGAQTSSRTEIQVRREREPLMTTVDGAREPELAQV